jgi:spore maturation protein CgeB
MRTFEIPAAGGIQLAPYSREQELFFEAGKEIFFFRNDEEMIQQAKDIIGMSKSGALEIREAARRRSVGSDYTFRNRAQTVFKTFENFPGRVRQ